MKPRTFCLIFLVLVGTSCHQGRQGKPSAAAWPGISDSAAAALRGSYSGNFKKGLLTVVINYVAGNIVSGYDRHRGLRRNLNGSIEERDSDYVLVLKEPGGSPYDGTFYLSMDKSGQKITGNWIPIDSTRIHSGTLNLSRSGQSGNDDDDFYFADWRGDLGTLSFSTDNTCKLEYDQDSTAHDVNDQLITINGNFLKKSDTILIDWQNNKRMPSLHMRLIRQPRQEISEDSIIEENLRGNGMKFVKFSAG
ncbi:MAG TPA: hypothetical protein VNV35_03495 [Puia sp.]|jgi:hypothetical protein|nr:hypothetical protein [Puia sp.]